MKTNFLTIKLLFCLYFSLNSIHFFSQISNIQELIAKNDKSVLKIFTNDEFGELLCQGSGIVIDSKGIGITNFHVLEGASNAIAVNTKGEKFKIEKIIDFSLKCDLVKFQLQNSNYTIFPKATLNFGKNSKGSNVFSIGYPNGFQLIGESTVGIGIISGIRTVEVLKGQGDLDSIIQTSVPITHGNSGGGLFDSKGNLIGITQGTFANNIEDLHANLNCAIPTKYIKSLNRNLNLTFEQFLNESANYSLYSKGVIAYLSKDFATSYDLLKKYQDLNPKNLLKPEVWYTKGNCAFHLGCKTKNTKLYKLALDNYFEALKLDSMSVNLRSYMALAFEELGDFEYAFEVAFEGLKLNNKNAFCNYVIGKLYNSQNQREIAIKYLTSAITLFEEKKFDQESLAKWILERAVAYEMKEDLKNAETDYLKSLKLNTSDVVAWYRYGNFLLYCKRNNEACNAFKTLQSLDPNYTEYNGSVKELLYHSCY